MTFIIYKFSQHIRSFQQLRISEETQIELLTNKSKYLHSAGDMFVYLVLKSCIPCNGDRDTYKHHINLTSCVANFHTHKHHISLT